MTLDRYPLDTLAGHEPGRQVKLGPALDDARPIMTPTAPADVLDTLKAHGYTGTVDQVLTHSARFPVTIPEGTRGIVEGVDADGRWAIVAFVWKTPKSGKVTAAIGCQTPNPRCPMFSASTVNPVPAAIWTTCSSTRRTHAAGTLPRRATPRRSHD